MSELDAYRGKRDFGRSPEPAGDDGGGGEGGERRGRFVIQKHDASRLHYDLRLELDGVLKSWAVPKGPSLDPGTRRLAVRTEDHPLGYRDFEGIIPEDEYGGGTVLIWDRGAWEADGDPRAALADGRLDFRLRGEKLRGAWLLVRTSEGEGEGGEGGEWLLIKRSDGAARPDAETAVTEAEPDSVASGRTMEEVGEDPDRVWRSSGVAWTERLAGVPGAREGALPGRVPVQLARLTDDAPGGEAWLHEVKHDGYRILVRLEEGGVRLLTRGEKDWTDRYPRVARSAERLAADAALVDGEVVRLDADGLSDFQALQDADGDERSLFYYAFDLLHLEGVELGSASLLERKRVLRELLDASPAGEAIRYSSHVRGHGDDFFREACAAGCEGIVSKRADAAYSPGRGGGWLKVKCVRRQELVVVGFTEPSGSRPGLGALVLGVGDGRGELVYAGRVGTGFTRAKLRELRERLETIEREDPPVAEVPRGREGREVRWVRPELVAEVEFTEWTADGRLRHPSFRGLREDREPGEVVRETAAVPDAGAGAGGRRAAGRRGRSTGDGGAGDGGSSGSGSSGSGSSGSGSSGDERTVAGVRLSSPDRVLWEEQGVTKRELALYWQEVAPGALEHMADRPLTLLRCPSGAAEDCFYQKHPGRGIPEAVPRVEVEESDGPATYMAVRRPEHLVALVQLGTLEFHVWNARSDRLERPDRLVFDLDPGEGVGWEELRLSATTLRDALDHLGLRSFVRTTGGKGIHVVVPLVRRSGWSEAKAFARGVARALERAGPDRFVAEMSKSKRRGKIFVDYLRNDPNATAVATWSPRARPGAPVAVPLSWAELEEADELPRWTLEEAAGRYRSRTSDPWEEMGDVRQSITKEMRASLGLD